MLCRIVIYELLYVAGIFNITGFTGSFETRRLLVNRTSLTRGLLVYMFVKCFCVCIKVVNITSSLLETTSSLFMLSFLVPAVTSLTTKAKFLPTNQLNGFGKKK